MPYRYLPDGSIITESLNEIVALARALPRDAASRRASPAEPSTGRRRGRRPRAQLWTSAHARTFLSQASEKVHALVDAAVALGDSGDTKTLSAKLGVPSTGIGQRVLRVRTEAAAYNEALPPPVALTGDTAPRQIQIEASFLAAMQELGGSL